MKELYRLRDKLELLLQQYKGLQQEVSDLKKTVNEKDVIIEKFSEEKKNLEERLSKLSLKKNLETLPESQKEKIKKQIDLVLDMLKNNMALLK